MNYTAQQIEQAIEWSDEFESWGEADWWTGKHRLVLDIDGQTEYAEYIDSKIPAEGGGESIFVIFKVGSQFYRKSGYYLSHDGSYWDGDLEEVTPTEKLVTVYDTVGA